MELPFQQTTISKADGRGIERYSVFFRRTNCTFQDIRIAGNNRAVETVEDIREFFLLMNHDRIKDPVHSPVYEIEDMSVGKFGREADVFRHHC